MRDLRAQVWERCKGLCEKCGIPLDPDDWALHHRKLKSRGGKDEISNVMSAHHFCHNLGTNSIHLNPHEATRLGQMVPSWADPAETPLILDDGSEVLLTTRGHYFYMKRTGFA